MVPAPQLPKPIFPSYSFPAQSRGSHPPSSLGAAPLAPLLQRASVAHHCTSCRCLSAPALCYLDRSSLSSVVQSRAATGPMVQSCALCSSLSSELHHLFAVVRAHTRKKSVSRSPIFIPIGTTAGHSPHPSVLLVSKRMGSSSTKPPSTGPSCHLQTIGANPSCRTPSS
jgi:hypothetical protein